jgi:hypothetical protein
MSGKIKKYVSYSCTVFFSVIMVLCVFVPTFFLFSWLSFGAYCTVLYFLLVLYCIVMASETKRLCVMLVYLNY